MIRFFVAAFLTVPATCALAQDPPKPPAERAPLTVGDPAPTFTADEWVKGQPVPRFEKGRVYVVEFWAVWCVPCVANIPHLTALQAKHQDRVTVIGVTSADKNNTLEKVRKLVADKGDGIGYTIAWDANRKTFDAWMKAARQEGIPWAFLVNGDGVVAYIGYPGWMDEALQQILDGTYDMKAAAEQRRQELLKAERKRLLKVRIDASMQRVKKGETAEGRAELAALIDGDAKDESGSLMGIAWGMIEIEEKNGKPDFDLALKAAQRAVAIGEKNPYALDVLAEVWFRKGDAKKAAEFETRALDCAEAGSKDYFRANLKRYEKARDG